MRIVQYLARAGICSRRAAKDLLLSKEVTINDKIVTEPATLVKNTDIIKYKKNYHS